MKHSIMQELQHNDCKVTVFAKYIFVKGLIDYDNVIDLFIHGYFLVYIF